MKKGFEIAADLTEATFKSQLLTGVAKDIPYVSTLIKVWNLSDSIRDRMFASKIVRFIEAIDEVSKKEKDELSRKIKYLNQDDLERVTDKILFCIESITDIDKSEFIANFFIAYIYEKISERELRQCIDIVQTSFLDDLKLYVETCIGTYANEEDLNYQKIDGLISTPLFTNFRDDRLLQRTNDTDNIGKHLYKETFIGMQFRIAFNFGKDRREVENS
ncbi:MULTISPECIES: hypothetical protein [Pseudoalteromonas]|uniref:hypothetical protein n=1 Tax=Pseudoalteromonas TaxID=53246 RepID=UPI0015818254|nr:MULTISPECIES: hypothetical protein [Pseudoalteromonas]MDI4651145.1 hypothetical protein [Pseudoalteromonas shioyasakiensis]NUJ37642.1 hypothetical protein [Pseudoalteromonas sp. 0303]